MGLKIKLRSADGFPVFQVLVLSLTIAILYHSTTLPDIDDLDEDGVVSADDNCPNTANRNQSNIDGDGFGDACDDDIDDDTVPNYRDHCNGPEVSWDGRDQSLDVDQDGCKDSTEDYRMDLSGFDLTLSKLAGADLSGADLTNAVLTSVDLTGANLSGANLTNARLEVTDLTGANLSEADLTNADLAGADLTNADLTGAILTDVTLWDTIFTGANLTDATLGGMMRITMQSCPSSLPEYWTCIQLPQIEGGGFTLIGPGVWFHQSLTHSGLDRRNLSYSFGNLAASHANFGHTNFTGSNLPGSNLQYTTLNYAIFVDANLTGAFLNYATTSVDSPDESSINLAGANLAYANLNYANFAYATMTGTNLSGADITGADLSNSDLSYANLHNADMTDTDITGVIWTYAICPDGTNAWDNDQSCAYNL